MQRTLSVRGLRATVGPTMPRRRDDVALSRLGERLRALRVSRRLTQSQFAAEIGLEPETVSRCERGRQPLSVANLVRIATTYGVTVGSLVDAEGVISRPDLPDLELEMLNLFRGLGANEQAIAIRLFRAAVR